ncbi:MAG: hypothetical protein A3D26_01655 [Candidatus Blackburnbacteria bacterium RIFCSPHIGHO2_02_FULL_44_20]|uniref:Glycosyltransferase RgtA/B/C/D-like domain-containing protein n=1 Tax=Candidatus Blackburnbacteria bacterium RIFCSPHIGHO2_02_FULL_44_20 TaxID=1797516 RepID=A0A1G1V8P1_9BACT|nr:MAG: hypothetical protein A3E16_01060 [Candidatus Blackburnbacteria bacterium RIFCSPHIGHO2_12_FULL_44_25]OGY11795.1 MAG: hypothetical protein A3D26_01655 [Candidatus Blackburnbacteria bacterium RIFCSPHIGHO2_02_FULL_44_20]
MVKSNVIRRFGYLLAPVLLFVLSLATIYDYGMNWDSPIHFARGQAYLRYILSGKTDYSDLPSLCKSEYNLNSRIDLATGEVCDRHRKVRVSEYESHLLDFNSRVAQTTYGHPAFSDIMLAVSNGVFFKSLGLVEDVPAYHLYSVITTFLLVLIVSIWVKNTFGTFASVVAALTVYTFPLLFAEQHLNVKDPPMAAFFITSLYFFWLGLTRKNVFYILISALAGGASFGTKLNFVFAPFILLPWVILYSSAQVRQKLSKKKLSFGRLLNSILTLYPKKVLFALLAYPLIVFTVFFLAWPALWNSPIHRLYEVLTYYKDIGGSTCNFSYLTIPWFTKCTQTISLRYLLYTMPPVSLVLFFIGTIVAIFKFKEKNYVTVLWLTLFYFTILRVTLSITNIYGGLRQIIEFIAPMGMIAGVGALFLRNSLAKIVPQKLASFLIVLCFVPILWELKEIHPNQNVYFNSFIGGLKGAAARDFPGYGNTYGNVYLQGIKWLNKNAEPRARIALVTGNAQNISRLSLREDIDFSNGSRSGYNQEEEYQMLLIVGQDMFGDTFRQKYLDNFLNEIYSVKVDGVPILKIWKNDKQHLKEGLDLTATPQQFKRTYSVREGKKEVLISLYEIKKLKALTFSFPSTECKDKLIGAAVYTSRDNNQFFQKDESVNNFGEREIAGYGADFVFLFPGEEAQYIKLVAPKNYPCELPDISLRVLSFEN